MFDVIVIGGGVIGGMILRELTKYELKACLVEKGNDVCQGSSRANSGIVHAGFDAKEGTLKAKFNVLVHKMMEGVARDLGVKFKRNGSLVVAFSSEQQKTLEVLLNRGVKNGVEGLEIVPRERLRELEPNISDEAVSALYAPSGGIVCPYGLTIASIGNALDNGAELLTNFEVVRIAKTRDFFEVSSGERTVSGKVVINCAGLNAGRVASLIGDDYININARKGEYLLLDRECGDFVSRTLFFTPTEMGKGILVSPTVDGNILLGPTAENQPDGNTDTSGKGLAFVMEKAAQMCKKPPLSQVITSFAGVRTYSDKHDFIIEESKNAPGFIHCVGIESPGLTAAPAIAGYVASELVAKIIPVRKNRGFCGKRTSDDFFKKLSIAEKNDLIKKDSAYGRIICRCESVTEGEIRRAIRTNPPARDLDGVKLRTRTGMGRCQSGFCQPQVAEIIADELGISIDEVTKKGGSSHLLFGRTK
ncbi:MAG: NAD(P)/FAD-dependent oxidoreductase [Clostridia bacterium]|nr:NAD(P)/FAD-dependent oxidoreductase [Clostridia bacterium]